jgi:hypothetical protein
MPQTYIERNGMWVSRWILGRRIVAVRSRLDELEAFQADDDFGLALDSTCKNCWASLCGPLGWPLIELYLPFPAESVFFH